MAFIAGSYTATYAGLQLGRLEDGIYVESDMSTEPIVGDSLGDTIQDGVYRGGNTYISFVLLEFNLPAARFLYWPQSAAWGNLGIMGVLLSTMYSSLVMTAVAGTTATPATITFPLCGLAPGFPVRTLHANRLKRVPLRLLALPVIDSSTGLPFLFRTG
jgi:hypothetical protein